ncbi:MAG: TetR/AcrR family transcriptional regulator [Parvibaculum sp.]|uniref:TetR/AcrR family transcriptional regulator n=1 Tax=Parvibaculum sp. TaxID=2024848 RepID=UPI00261099B9|nr:TetR/AcrR family transcriptional regulator [Parvibaculum sp.]MBX3492263.1 TetR/AcrR family transcriptional regulator [Parvibaculum sp.]MBX3496288.1 TetR/AcrR family transcriptional regulator [Parvibaculum sp.]MCW5727286.1 TetR/AcrR family transcriptional regulator [Parvibaculum sp.]
MTRESPAKRPSKNRDKLLKAARRLFAERGYAETGTEDIVREAGVTRGALYHQFADKRDLFRAMLEEMLPEIGQRLFEETMARIAHDREDLQVGCRVLLGIYTDAEVRRLFLIEGPAVLGLADWQALQAPLSTLFLDHALQHLVDEGFIAAGEMRSMNALLSGALQQAALGIAAAGDPEAARADYTAGLDRIIEGLMRRT